MFWPRIFLIFQEGTFQARKVRKLTLKKCLTFREMERSTLKPKKILKFQEGTLKSRA